MLMIMLPSRTPTLCLDEKAHIGMHELEYEESTPLGLVSYSKVELARRGTPPRLILRSAVLVQILAMESCPLDNHAHCLFLIPRSVSSLLTRWLLSLGHCDLSCGLLALPYGSRGVAIP